MRFLHCVTSANASADPHPSLAIQNFNEKDTPSASTGASTCKQKSYAAGKLVHQDLPNGSVARRTQCSLFSFCFTSKTLLHPGVLWRRNVVTHPAWKRTSIRIFSAARRTQRDASGLFSAPGGLLRVEATPLLFSGGLGAAMRVRLLSPPNSVPSVPSPGVSRSVY